MKKVIFVCLLTLAVCLSQPAGEQATPSPSPNAAAGAPATGGSPGTAAPAAGAQTTTAAPSQAPAGTTQNQTDPKLTTQKPTESTKPSSEAGPPADNKDSHTTTLPTKPTTVNDSTTAAPTTPKTITPVTNGTTTTTTPKPTTPQAAATTAVPTLQARGFDGASFVGGIILTLGLIAIGFMGFKYYKAQTERNYHTL